VEIAEVDALAAQVRLRMQSQESHGSVYTAGA